MFLFSIFFIYANYFKSYLNNNGNIHDTLRLNYSFQTTNLKGDFSYVLNHYYKEFQEVFHYRLTDSKINFYNYKNNHFTQNLDRLNLMVSTPIFDLTIGRQAISFGTTTYSPTDVLLPFSLTSLDKEYRQGIDAIRVQIPINRLSELDLGIIANENNAIYFSKFKYYLKETDLNLLLVNDNDAFLLGGGLSRSIKDFGYKLDLAYGKEKEEYYLSVAQDIEYAFSNNLLLILEYIYNTSGATNSYNLMKFPYNKEWSYLLGKNYFNIIINYSITPLLTLNAQMLTNLNDPSSLLTLSAAYDIGNDLYGDIVLFDGFGSSNGFEFERIKPTIYGSIRYYF